MIECPYYTSDSTEDQANLPSCLAEPNGRYAVVLDRTLFHPQGGGQSADAGWINDKRVEIILAHGNDAVHIVVRPLLPGIMNLRVDATLRQLHARPHPARRLIGLTGTAFGWLLVKTHH